MFPAYHDRIHTLSMSVHINLSIKACMVSNTLIIKCDYSWTAWPPTKTTANHALHTESAYNRIHRWLWYRTAGTCVCDNGANGAAVGCDTVGYGCTCWNTNSWSPLQYSLSILDVSNMHILRWF